MLSSKKSILKRVLITIIAAIIAFSAISMVITKIVYDNIFTRYDCEYLSVPEELERTVENRITYQYNSGENRLCGFLYESIVQNGNDGLIVLAPGFNACADDYLWQIKSLNDYGWSVFAFDTTGCCHSEGESSVGFAQELIDIDATLSYIEQNGAFGYNDIMLLGHSRGGYAVCCALGYEHDVTAVVSVSGINSAMEGVIGSSVDKVGALAYCNYPFLWLYQSMLFGTKVMGMSADEALNSAGIPALIVHGSDDEQVPDEKYSIISHRDSIESQNVEYYICDESGQNGHTNLLFDDDGTANDELMKKINDFYISSIK